jgi:DNA recombination protein RmuC
VALQALQLANALTINSRITGTWGEMVLRRVLEEAGLHEGREYRLQHSIEGSAGEDQRPDAILFLPEDRQLVIDSKVSNKAWVEYCDAKDEAARAQALAQHVASVRAHMKGLARRDYARSPELKGADFVLMFVPVEAALLAALAQDPALYGDGYRSRIIFVTPSTLLAVARLVEGLWIVEKRERSADEIAEAARKLYEKLANFAVSFLDVGESLASAGKAFNQARGQLSEGPGNAMRLAERLRELGVQPAKSLPEELLKDALFAEEPLREDGARCDEKPLQGNDEAGRRGQAR